MNWHPDELDPRYRMKSQFLTRTSLDVWGDGDWILLEPLIYQSSLLGGEVVVPSGFVTDLASIPRIARRIIHQNGRHRYAAIVHDYLYRIHNGGSSWIETLDREICDRVFLEAMEVLNVSSFKRKTMYRAVRLGGWASFNHRKGLEPRDIGNPDNRPLTMINVEM